MLALMALGVGAGDEVITVPFTFVATAGPITLLGAKPVFVDIDPVTFNIDVTEIEGAITPRTKAIIPVDLFGLLAPLESLEKVAERHGIAVIEDAAQAIGTNHRHKKAGSFGTLGCFSFFPTKNLGAAGDGGMVTTNDDALAAELRQIRVHGSPRRYEYDVQGVNSRLDALQAVVLSVKLRHLDSWANQRRVNANRYGQLFEKYDLLKHVTVPAEPEGYCHVFNQYTVRAKERDRLRAYLTDKGLPTEIYYPYPLHLQKAFAELGYKDRDFPESERAAREVLSLPIYAELPHEHQRLLVEAMAGFYRQ
jgi:dTDP-4-amino-4,6-dideoxygalactose transaminase